MPDMLVKLYDLPNPSGQIEELREKGIEIRNPIPPEKHVVTHWVQEEFSAGWASECDASFAKQPVSSLIALENGNLVGFACYDTTTKGFFGPTGVKETARGKGIGKVLLLASLQKMFELGYAYAIIGGAGPTQFYAQTVGAIEIEGSKPGIYRGMLRE